MASIVDLIKPEIAFDPETISVLSTAFEEAWERLLKSGSECTRPAYARAMREVVARRIIDMAQRGTKDKKELVEGRFLAANYRLEKKDRQISSKTAVAPAGLPEISPGSGQSPNRRNNLLEVLHRREDFDPPIRLRYEKATSGQFAFARRPEPGHENQVDGRPSVSDCGRQSEPVH